MTIQTVISQLRTTDLAASIRFYTATLGLTLEFQYEDFYAGIRAGGQLLHLKLVDNEDPSIDFVKHGEHVHLYFDVTDVRAMARALEEHGGHTLSFGERHPAESSRR